MTAPRLLAATVAALLCLAAAPAAHAHSELPTHTWCQNGRVVELERFDIPASALIDLRTEDECPPAGSPIQKDCGQFDDDYGIAKSAATAMCAIYQPPRKPKTDIGTVIFLIDTPSYTAGDHHEQYEVQDGLHGSCVRCMAPLPPPATPAPVPVGF